jgi:hypothetical protein
VTYQFLPTANTFFASEVLAIQMLALRDKMRKNRRVAATELNHSRSSRQ